MHVLVFGMLDGSVRLVISQPGRVVKADLSPSDARLTAQQLLERAEWAESGRAVAEVAAAVAQVQEAVAGVLDATAAVAWEEAEPDE